jgi:uncharacterized membrane protein
MVANALGLGKSSKGNGGFQMWIVQLLPTAAIAAISLVSAVQAASFVTDTERDGKSREEKVREKVVFCNKFAQTMFVALAYPHSNDSFISRGWLRLDQGECKVFDAALRLKTFYYRAETDWYSIGSRKKNQQTWGDGKKFALKNDTFSFYDADKERNSSEARFAGFTELSIESQDGSVVTVTFESDGVHSTWKSK